MTYSIYTPDEVAKSLAKRLKELRLLKKMKRTTLAERSGVSTASLIRFEQKGLVSLENLLKLMHALGRLDEIDQLLVPPLAQSIDELEQQGKKSLQRGTL